MNLTFNILIAITTLFGTLCLGSAIVIFLADPKNNHTTPFLAAGGLLLALAMVLGAH